MWGAHGRNRESYRWPDIQDAADDSSRDDISRLENGEKAVSACRIWRPRWRPLCDHSQKAGEDEGHSGDLAK